MDDLTIKQLNVKDFLGSFNVFFVLGSRFVE